MSEAVCNRRWPIGGATPPRGENKAGDQPLEVPLKRRPKGLIKIADVEYELALRRREAPIVQKVHIATALDNDGGRRCMTQIMCLDGRSAPEEAERQFEHSRMTDRNEVLSRSSLEATMSATGSRLWGNSPIEAWLRREVCLRRSLPAARSVAAGDCPATWNRDLPASPETTNCGGWVAFMGHGTPKARPSRFNSLLFFPARCHFTLPLNKPWNQTSG